MEIKDKNNRKFLDWLRGKPCVFCGMPGVPHHFGMLAQGNGIGTKCDDTYTVPLCNKHHRMLHNGQLGSKAELYKKFELIRDRYMNLFIERKERCYGSKN